MACVSWEDGAQGSVGGDISDDGGEGTMGEDGEGLRKDRRQKNGIFEGKIVLVQRGKCAFAEKIRRVQDAGGIAVVVGDNTPSSGLLTMYAKGNLPSLSIILSSPRCMSFIFFTIPCPSFSTPFLQDPDVQAIHPTSTSPQHSSPIPPTSPSPTS